MNVNELFHIGVRDEKASFRIIFIMYAINDNNVLKRNGYYILTCLYPHFESYYTGNALPTVARLKQIVILTEKL